MTKTSKLGTNHVRTSIIVILWVILHDLYLLVFLGSLYHMQILQVKFNRYFGKKLKRPEKSVFLLCFEFLSIVKIYTPTTSADELSGQFSFFVISSLSFTRLSISSSKVLMSLN